jgi:hypothetical protein
MADPILAVDAQGLRQLARDVNRIADKDLRLRFRKGLNKAGEIVAAEARSRSGWSSRIPSTIRTGVTTRGVYVRAGGPRAPHAVTFEGKADGSARRHPVFARGARSNWTWVAQDPRPFLRPALASKVEDVMTVAADSLLDAFVDNGFRRN